MAEGGHEEGLGHSMEPEGGDLSHSVSVGSQEHYEFFCQPCDMDHNQVEATFYCGNCEEYLCIKCNTSHKKFKQVSDHDILDMQNMAIKPPVSIKSTAAIPLIGNTSFTNPVPATTIKVSKATNSGRGKSGHSLSPNPAPVSTKEVIKATLVNETKIRGSISSFALISTNKLLETDSFDTTVRLVDIDMTVSRARRLELPGRPWQATRISATEAAVTIPNGKKIVLLTTQPELSVVREINVREECWGIAYVNNKLIVTVTPVSGGCIDILDMSGKVLRSILTDQTGNNIFAWPCFLTVDPVNGSMYVSDYWQLGSFSRVVKLNNEGSVEAAYTSSERAIEPRQVALDTQGTVYVAWVQPSGGWVDQLSADCVKLRTLIPDLSPSPWALSYDEATQQLYVGQQNGVVKVYKLD